MGRFKEGERVLVTTDPLTGGKLNKPVLGTVVACSNTLSISVKSSDWPIPMFFVYTQLKKLTELERAIYL